MLWSEYLNSCEHPASYLGIPQIGKHEAADKWLLDNAEDGGQVVQTYKYWFGKKLVSKLLVDTKALRGYLTGYFCFHLYDHVVPDKMHGLGPVVKTDKSHNIVFPLTLDISRIFHAFRGTMDLREFKRVLSVHSGREPLKQEVIQKLLKRMYDAFVAIHSKDLKARLVNGHRPLERLSMEEIYITPGVVRHELAHEHAAYCLYATMMHMKFWTDRGFSLRLQELHI
jgi:hypothetical protein